MPSYRWSYLIATLCGVGSASWGTATSAFQFPPLSDDINTRFIHQPDAWIGGGFQSNGPINQSPAEFGPTLGMPQRSPDGNPASGDSFPMMTPGSLPGGLSPRGFNGSGMWPPVNQPSSRDNRDNATRLGVNGQSPFGQNPSVQNSSGQNPSGQTPFGTSTQATSTPRIKPKVSWALETTQEPYVGLLGQIARPGVYEIERRGTLLSDLLQNIGGLAKDATGQFRIIRNGRPGQMISYSGAAQFELMPGDLIIADAQPTQVSQRPTNSKSSSDDAVQIGFVNLVGRPVVLKLRSERASVAGILATMGQDQSLAAQIRIVAPTSQRFQGQPNPEAKLASETVLIFPQNVVKQTGALELLPEPFKLKRETSNPAPSSDTTPPAAPQSNLSPDVTHSTRPQPSVGAWTDSTPLPPTSQPISRSSVDPTPDVAEVPPPPSEDVTASRTSRDSRRTAPRTAVAPDRIARDSHMLLAPPVEGSTLPSSDAPSTDIPQDRAPIPELKDATLLDDPSDEPSLLKAHGKKRPIRLAKDVESDEATLTSADLDDAEAAADQAGANWSIWPPILTAGVGLLALMGFSLSLRRRTQAMTQTSETVITQSQPTSAAHRNSHSTPRRELLDEIIDDQLPLAEEKVSFASPMQFHGRPQPPKTIRMDQQHALPKPHSPKTAEVKSPRSEINRQAATTAETDTITAPRSSKSVSQKFRIDRTGTTGTGTKVVPSVATSSSSQSSSGPLDRALSAVQKQNLQKREERGA